MKPEQLDSVVAALRAGKSFSLYGADGEWGLRYSGGDRFLCWTHDPGQDVPDRLLTEAEARRQLAPFSYEKVVSRLTG